MSSFKDLTDKKIGRLTVIKRVDNILQKNGKPVTRWLCQCECGNIKIIRADTLGRGTNSCGCLKNELNKKKRTNDPVKPKRLYKIWCCMKSRCYNKNLKAYKDYGMRGIQVCEEWLNDFRKFEKWALNNGYQEELTIDRINNNGNYEPSNCRWVTKEIQDNNRRNNRKITYKGQTKTLSQWSREYNINIVTLSDRLKAGLSIDEALNKPVIKSGGKLIFTINNETKLLSEWCKMYNINYQTAWKKIKNGKSIEKALKLN